MAGTELVRDLRKSCSLSLRDAFSNEPYMDAVPHVLLRLLRAATLRSLLGKCQGILFVSATEMHVMSSNPGQAPKLLNFLRNLLGNLLMVCREVLKF